MAYKVNTDGIVDELIRIMETEDRIPVPKQWDDPFARPIPYNLSTGKSYNGFNIMALWVRQIVKGYPTNAWMTLNQARTISPDIRLSALPDAPEGKTGQKAVPIHRRDTSIGKEYEDPIRVSPVLLDRSSWPQNGDYRRWAKKAGIRAHVPNGTSSTRSRPEASLPNVCHSPGPCTDVSAATSTSMVTGLK